MPIAEVTGGGTINGAVFTKNNTSELQATFDGADQTTTPQLVVAGQGVSIVISGTFSATLQIQTANVGDSNFVKEKPVVKVSKIRRFFNKLLGRA